MTDQRVEAPSAAPPPAVLIVDDAAAKRLAIRAILAPVGLDLVEVESGRAALRAVLRQSFALILMDVRMPTMDGYETAKLIRQRSQTRLTPIIFVTASVEEHPMATATAYASGAVDFINGEVVRVSTSIGIALYPAHGKTTADLLRRADLAMYDAKRSGAKSLFGPPDGVSIPVADVERRLRRLPYSYSRAASSPDSWWS